MNKEKATASSVAFLLFICNNLEEKMKKKRPPYITLEEFEKQFSPKEMREIEAMVAHYDVFGTFREERKSQKMTQAALAKKANIHRVTVVQVEAGSRNVTVNVLHRLARALGKNLELRLR